MARHWDYDEDDVRVRPPRSSRPRSRLRPRHAEAVEAMVTEVHLGRYVCVRDQVTVIAMRARELGRRAVVVGDRVALVGDVSGHPDRLARIVRVEPRSSELRRSADDDVTAPAGRGERVLVANADQLVIVSSLVDPPPRTGFIDRCLVAAYQADIEPLLCLTKADLVTNDGPLSLLQDYYATLDLPYVLCRPDRPLTELSARLRGRMSVLVGHSGVGKSTLVNRLVPEADRAVGAVSAIGKGRHTSASAVALRLPTEATGTEATGTEVTGTEAATTEAVRAAEVTEPEPAERSPGWIVDTPGVRSFGLAHVSPDSLLESFTDLVAGSADCPPHCDHTAGGDCALDAWVAAGHADPRRLASFRRLLASRGTPGLG